jgi:hypothetical protein
MYRKNTTHKNTMNNENQILDKTDKSHDVIFGKALVSKVHRLKWNIESCKQMGEFRMVPKHLLNIDGDYQRDSVSRSKVTDIARTWNWVLFGTLIVAERPDGTLWVIEGGHRTRASFYRSDINLLPCMVHRLEVKELEAKAFLGSNKFKTNVCSMDEFRASILAGDETAVGVDGMINDWGYRVANSHGTRYVVKCVNTLMSSWRHDPFLTRRCFAFFNQIEEGAPISSHCFSGLFYAETNCEESILTQNNAQKIKQLGGIDAMIAAINRQVAINGKGGDKVYAVGILSLINKGKKNKIALKALQ